MVDSDPVYVVATESGSAFVISAIRFMEVHLPFPLHSFFEVLGQLSLFDVLLLFGVCGRHTNQLTFGMHHPGTQENTNTFLIASKGTGFKTELDHAYIVVH